jgi:hypothetical protein
LDRIAGDFDEWLDGMRAVLRNEAEADVPCAGCVGCCVSGYVIPLRPWDRVALERVPDRHLQLRPGISARILPRPDGTCPMQECGRCTIYADRPQTCRDYDCRVYAAAGLEPDGDRPVILERVREWRFEFADEAARARAAAVRRAAAFIRAHAERFPAAFQPRSAAEISVLAVKVFALFAGEDAALEGDAALEERIAGIVEAVRKFDAGLQQRPGSTGR